jgi:hypothetical protein
MALFSAIYLSQFDVGLLEEFERNRSLLELSAEKPTHQ